MAHAVTMPLQTFLLITKLKINYQDVIEVNNTQLLTEIQLRKRLHVAFKTYKSSNNIRIYFIVLLFLNNPLCLIYMYFYTLYTKKSKNA